MKPLVNIVMIARNRPRLTRQALDSLFENTEREHFTLTLVDDASECSESICLIHFADQPVRCLKRCGSMGVLRNLGVNQLAGPRINPKQDWIRRIRNAPYLYFSDNDAYFMPGWLETMIEKFEDFGHPLGILGGYNHPYHMPYHERAGVRLFHSLGAFSMLMPWDHWGMFGPFDESANPDKPQANQGEDVLLCEKVKKAGYLIGATYPFVVLNCGLTSTDGKPCTGAHAVAGEPRLEGVIYE